MKLLGCSLHTHTHTKLLKPIKYTKARELVKAHIYFNHMSKCTHYHGVETASKISFVHKDRSKLFRPNKTLTKECALHRNGLISNNRFEYRKILHGVLVYMFCWKKKCSNSQKTICMAHCYSNWFDWSNCCVWFGSTAFEMWNSICVRWYSFPVLLKFRIIKFSVDLWQ